MNFKTVIPIATALLGFVLGWVVRSPGVTGSGDQTSTGGGDTHGLGSGSDGSPDGRPNRPSISKRPTVTTTAPTPESVAMQQRMEEAFKDAGSARDRSKLIRLAEALGLNSEQLAQFDALLTQQREQSPMQVNGLSPRATLEKMAESALAFDVKFRAMLGPEQSAALDALRARQAGNRAEARAQRDLADMIDRVDVSPAQREAVAEVLRTATINDQAKMPAGVSLLMESSFLPGSVGAMSDRSIEAMLALGDDTNAATDPMAVDRRMIELQRERILARATALEGILTPAQLAQYRVTIDIQNAFSEAITPPRKK